MKPRIYLAGPISGCTYGECTDWRGHFEVLVGSGVQCLSPMRGKGYLARETSIGDNYPQHVMSSQRGITTRDFYDCTRADLVLVNFLGAKAVSIGTVLEVAWAFSARIPLIAVMEPEGNLHDHGMVRECIGFRVETLEEAAHVARVVLWPEGM